MILNRTVIGRLFASALLMGLATSAAPPPPRPVYTEGQVWEYDTRPGDAGSLLKIQEINTTTVPRSEPIFHVSIVGVHFPDSRFGGEIGHMPFSRAALDASLTKLSTSQAVFPDASAGIREWRDAQGGVFTITVKEAVEFVEQATRQPSTKSNDVG